jgi:WhiB family transcriptional regulator, redox-sensing transcriptional regulator
MSDVADFVDWRELAACLSENPELFFPMSGTARGLRQARRAKAVCGSCPVRQRCLDYALDTRQAYGIWGGLGEDERVSLRAALGRGEPGRARGWPGSAARAVDGKRERTRRWRNVLPPHRG